MLETIAMYPILLDGGVVTYQNTNPASFGILLLVLLGIIVASFIFCRKQIDKTPKQKDVQTNINDIPTNEETIDEGNK